MKPVKIKLFKNQIHNLTENQSITFIFHSHKKARPETPTPLIIHVEYKNDDVIEKKEYHFFTNYQKIKKNSKKWTWQNFKFVLTDYIYNDYMLLKIFTTK